MGRKLAAYVYDDQGVLHVPGEEPSAEVAAQITNPKAWAELEPGPEPEPGQSAVKK